MGKNIEDNYTYEEYCKIFMGSDKVSTYYKLKSSELCFTIDNHEFTLKEVEYKHSLLILDDEALDIDNLLLEWGIK